MASTNAIIGTLAVVILLYSCSNVVSESSEKTNSKKGGMEEFFPFMFMLMNGAPAIHMPTVWMVAALSTVSIAAVVMDLVKFKLA